MPSIGAKTLPTPAWLARGALFVVYAWFGGLKLAGLSPASELVRALQAATLPFLEFQPFFAFYGGFELVLGVLLLWPRVTRLALTLLLLHVGTTLLPLFVLPDIAWRQLLVPTLEGQYILKNVLILAAAGTILQELRQTTRGPARLVLVTDREPPRAQGAPR